jgi:hypothetical protein
MNHAGRIQPKLPLTNHAQCRMNARRLSNETVMMVLTYGRLARVRGAEIYAIGRREIERYLHEGVNLSRFEGVQVVCSPDGSILTVYRNNDFRGLRPRGGLHYCKAAA